MALFTSNRERYYWMITLVIIAAIYSSLVIKPSSLRIILDEYYQPILFITAMILIALSVIWYGIQKRPGKLEFGLILVLSAVFIMVILRLGIAERTHLIEYSSLSLVVHQALSERFGDQAGAIKPAMIASFICIGIGVLDECLQLFIPYRVFDMIDILFNTLAVIFAIGGRLLLRYVVKRCASK